MPTATTGTARDATAGRAVLTCPARCDCGSAGEPAVVAQVRGGIFLPGLTDLTDRFHATTTGAAR